MLGGRAKETLILPVLARDEEPQPTTQESMFNYVRLSQGGPSRAAEARSEVSILTTLGQRVLAPCPVDWKKLESHQAIRELIADLIPGLEELKTIDAKKKEFHIPGRILHQPVFPTSTGKAYFHVTPLPQQDVPEGHLRLMTIRSEGQFNTVVYEEEDLYRHQERRDIILLHKTDMEQHGISDNERITIRSSTGVMHNILARSFDIHPGNAAMYFPEANVLVPRGVDPHSRTPAFKSVLIQLEPERQGLTQAEDLIRKLQKRPFHE